MIEITKLIKSHFDKYPLKVDMEAVTKQVLKYNLTNNQVDDIFKIMRQNISFFEKQVGYFGLDLSNMLQYSNDAMFLEEKEWSGSKNRNRITKEYQEILRGTININDFKKEEDEKISDAIYELEMLIGLRNIKDEIKALAALAKIRKKKIELGLPVTPSSLHMVFVGNPGTGKTTVARLVGQIYKSLNLLENGHVVETSRKDLIGQYIGHTAPLVEKKFKEADGGILFIDEAYSLTTYAGTNDFGSEAVQTLLKLMEDNRERTIVIVAGYPNEMKTFINSNPGLQSRFSTYIFFEDYTTPDLIEILKFMIGRDEHTISDAALVKLQYLMEEKYGEKGVNSNARFIRNLYEQILKNQALRLTKIQNPTRLELQTIIDNDIPEM